MSHSLCDWQAMGNHQWAWGDSVLDPGEEVTFTERGRIVVEALRMATVRLKINTAARVKAPAPLGRLQPMAGMSA